MKFLGLVAFLFVFSATSHAESETPYSREAFQAAQQKNENVVLHFYADWCSTCRAQKKTLGEMDKSGALKGVQIFAVNYDKETDLRKEMKVTSQATFIAWHGKTETGRVLYLTSADDIKNFLNKSLAK